MDFSLSDHQKLIRDTVRQFMEAEVRPTIRRRDREEKFATAELAKLAEMGCCGMMVPEERGGAAMDTIAYALMIEEGARADAPLAVAGGEANRAVAIPLHEVGKEL